MQLIPSELNIFLPRHFEGVRLRDFHLRHKIMRLIHTSKLELHEFFGDAIPPYAILSHYWEDEEVSF